MPKINLKSSSKKVASLRKNLLLIFTVASLTTAAWWFSNRLDLAFGQVADINAVSAAGGACDPSKDTTVVEGPTKVVKDGKGNETTIVQYFKCVAKTVYSKKVVILPNNNKQIIDAKKCMSWKNIPAVYKQKEAVKDKNGKIIKKAQKELVKKASKECTSYKATAPTVSIGVWKLDHEEKYVKKFAGCTYKGKLYEAGKPILDKYTLDCKKANDGGAETDGDGFATCKVCNLSCDLNGRMKETCTQQPASNM